MFNVSFLHAGGGDSIFVTYLDNKNIHRNILIDGGTGKVYQNALKDIVEKIDQLDLVIVTHIDLDHIGGINKLLESKHSKKIKKIYFNSADLIKKTNSSMISISDGIKLTEFIQEQGIEIFNDNIVEDEEFNENGLSIKFLSPTIEALYHLNNSWTQYEEEQSLISSTFTNDTRLLSEIAKDKFEEKSLTKDVANWSSLAFIISYEGVSILLLGDAKDSVLVKSLKSNKYTSVNRCQVDYVKVSHHGSKYNTSIDFLSLIESNNFIFSTNGTHNHPDIETIARIICHPERDYCKKINLYFNYPKSEYEQKNVRLPTQEEEAEFNFQSIYDFKILELGRINCGR
ncbi:MAG: beta-lactamase superfamily II metal-dependent hydrolase [Sulfurimonas sp.]|jgi:beta-lactamase superfamily II metal-dependent hydrolase|uniref:ComEC/Rec2 family competence protein n=1 Tax=Sulfurimonas sp. TaxID=2022749 RepID=UPI0039E66CB2